MSSDIFQVAAARARASCSPYDWNTLTTAEQSAAIYRELRLLDIEAAGRMQTDEAPPDAPFLAPK
jgi:hypothetical protein